MQLKSCFLFFGVIICSYSFGQKLGKDEINFSDPFQIDSSEYFLIPRLIDSENQASYGKGKGYLPWGNYSNIYFYNSTTNQTKKLFETTLSLISPFNPRRFNYEYKPAETPENFLNKHIVYLARTENFNGDNALDSEDPIYLYISTKAGDNLTQITPKALNVVSWSLSKDKKIILVKLQQDKNGNKKFGIGDDEVYYRIDLHDDISKIKCYPIIM
jgi:hypothetical protein